MAESVYSIIMEFPSRFQSTERSKTLENAQKCPKMFETSELSETPENVRRGSSEAHAEPTFCRGARRGRAAAAAAAAVATTNEF